MKNMIILIKKIRTKRFITVMTAIICIIIQTGCGGSGNNAAQSEPTETGTVQTAESGTDQIADSGAVQPADTGMAYDEIMSADHLPIEEAYESLRDNASNDPEQQAFVQKLKDLMNCSGKFANTTESGNRYSADVSFYLSSGKIFSTVTYSGYRGEIKDGEVLETSEEGYLFMSEPKGDLYGREQDFHLYFGRENLHIMWADTCDYILDRGDGSAESVEDYKVPFDQTETYQTIVELLDKSYTGIDHDLEFDAQNKELNLYFGAPGDLRAALDTKDAKLMESWDDIVESMKKLCDSLQTVTQIGGKVDYVNIYWVDQLNSSNDYSEQDHLLWIRNGTVRYNYANEAGKKTGAGSGSESGSGSNAGNGSGSATGGHTPTRGEANALNKALQYLNYSAFSYTGLIEQLEFEGYTHSEAVYAVDNCGADWDQQAVRKAEQYLEYSSFSRSALVEQLEFEGFTHEQAEYAVSVVY